MLQRAYREEGRRDAGCTLYAQMPQTIQTVFAKELTKAQSDVSAKRADACKENPGLISGEHLSLSVCVNLMRSDHPYVKVTHAGELGVKQVETGQTLTAEQMNGTACSEL